MEVDEPEEFEVYGDILRVARLLAGLSQDDVAERVGISRQTLAKVENMTRETAQNDLLHPVRKVLEKAGIEFIKPSTNGSEGLRWARRSSRKRS